MKKDESSDKSGHNKAVASGTSGKNNAGGASR
jgi:hypothetical protein